MDPADLPSPLVLTRRLGLGPAPAQTNPTGRATLQLALSADERTRLRGLRRSVCGKDLLLQLPRGKALEPGEWLDNTESQPPVQVVAAPESLLVVTATDPLALLQAAYHLGNRHVSLELRAGELRLLEDSVLEQLLLLRGLTLRHELAPFLPEAGAYSPSGHHHHHHAHADEPAHVHGHGHEHR